MEFLVLNQMIETLHWMRGRVSGPAREEVDIIISAIRRLTRYY